MDNHEQRPDSEAFSYQEHQYTVADDQPAPEAELNEEEESETEAYDYDREPPLDSATLRSNRKRSKYVFMTLCFLVALLFLYTYITNFNAGNGSDLFPLVGALVLGILGVVFLRSSDGPSSATPESETVSADGEEPGQDQEKKLTPFEELVQEALTTLPEEFQAQMENVMVRVEPEPDEETRQRIGLKEGYTLLGLYEGVPLTAYGRVAAPYPEIITIYQNAIEAHCRHNPTRIREQVRATVLHEIAHHFGMGHEEMPIWVK